MAYTNTSTVGVTSAGYVPGTPVQTGGGADTTFEDYGGQPVWGISKSGAVTKLGPGSVIAAGTTIAIGQPPPTGATGTAPSPNSAAAAANPPLPSASGDVVTGSEIAKQAEDKRHNIATETAQTTSNTNQAAAYKAQADASARAHEEAMAQYALQGAQAQAQYALDYAKYGEQVAQDNFNQRVAKAQQELAQAQFGVTAANFGLAQNEFNASQRQAQETSRENITKALADRKGPQDYVAYNNLLNGLSAPTPTSTTVSDPYAGLADLFKESKIEIPKFTPTADLSPSGSGQVPKMPDYPKLPSFAANPIAPVPAGGGTTGGTGITSPAALPSSGGTPSGYNPAIGGTQHVPASPSIPAATNIGSPSAPYQGQDQSGNIWKDNGTPGGMWTDKWGNTSLDGGKSWSNGQGTAAPLPATSGVQPVPAGGIPHEASGGTATGPVIVGDAKSGKPTGHEEIAYSAINPSTGIAETHVIPHDRIAGVLNQISGYHSGVVHPMTKMPKQFAALLPRAAGGGVFGGGLGGDISHALAPRTPVNYGAMPGPVPQQQDLPMTAPGIRVDGGNQTGMPVGNTGFKLGMGGSQTHTYGDDASMPVGGQPNYQPHAPQTAPGFQIPQTAAPSTPGTGITASSIPQAPLPSVSPSTTTNSSVGSTTTTNPQGPSTVTGAGGTYNGGLDQPTNVYSTYSPETLGNLPFYRKLIGAMPANPYGAFGAQLTNSAQGIYNAPTNINMRNYNLLRPSEQAQTESLYGQALGYNFDDLLAQARTAAPTDSTNGPYRRIMAPAMYGG